MKIELAKDTQKCQKLFKDWEETMIYSCLDGTMGKIYMDKVENPQTATAVIGGFVFYAGKPSLDFLAFKPENLVGKEVLLCGQTEGWNQLIREFYGENVREFTRYAFSKDPNVFDIAYLGNLTEQLPEDFEIKLFDEPIYNQCLTEEWSQDLVGNYLDFVQFEQIGLGVAILHKGQLIAGASSYTSYKGGIEIEVDTKETFRKQGLATIVSAKLILECLKRGLYPSWDAHTIYSANLAKKLGYQFSHEYTAFEVENF